MLFVRFSSVLYSSILLTLRSRGGLPIIDTVIGLLEDLFSTEFDSLGLK